MVILEINILEFVELQRFIQNEKALTLGQKMLYLGNFRPEFFLKNYFHI